jgi:hypothetical protein
VKNIYTKLIGGELFGDKLLWRSYFIIKLSELHPLDIVQVFNCM